MNKTKNEFEGSFPFKLIPTNLPGVYTRESLPENLDVFSASPRTLLKHGILARRPGPEDDPVLVKTWKMLFSKHRRLIVPVLEQQKGKIHALRGAKRQQNGTFTNGSWSGAVLPGSWFSVLAMWDIPTVSKPNVPAGTDKGWDSSSWIGLGGADGSGYLLQAGVQQSVDANGNASYVAWYEWFSPSSADDPSYYYQTNIMNMVVNPGDQIFCSVHYVTNSAGTTYGIINFVNGSEAETGFSIMLAAPADFVLNTNDVTAEWIMECPDYGYPSHILPDFTPVVFTQAFCCGPDCTLGNPVDADIYLIPASPPEVTSVELGNFQVTISYIPV